MEDVMKRQLQKCLMILTFTTCILKYKWYLEERNKGKLKIKTFVLICRSFLISSFCQVCGCGSGGGIVDRSTGEKILHLR